MVIIRIPYFLIIGHRKVEMKAKLRRILYPGIPPHSAAIFNVLKMLIAMVIDGDYVMDRDVIYCSRFFQNWHSPELPIGQYKMTADCRPGTKCKVGAKCRLQTADLRLGTKHRQGIKIAFRL